MSTPLESSLKASVAKRLKALAEADPSLCWRKRHGSAMTISGDPDITGLWNGLHFEIELKRPGENPTLLQSFRLDQWRKAGAKTFVVHDLAEFETALDSIRPASFGRH